MSTRHTRPRHSDGYADDYPAISLLADRCSADPIVEGIHNN